MTATTAATYLLYIMGEVFDDLTNMKLNKLLYFAQGYYLKKYGRPLFDNAIEAWEHGPVVPEVYSAYKKYGDKPIKEYDSNMIAEITPETEDLIFDVARQYGRYTISTLQNMACVAGSPWDQVYHGEHSHIEIPLTAIQSYFAKAEDLAPPVKQFKESDFIGYRDEDGVLVLPREWDDGEEYG